MAVIVKLIKEILITGEDFKTFSLLCKAQMEDAKTRLTNEQLLKVKHFADKCNARPEIWDH